MNPHQESEADDDLPQQNVPNLQLQAIMGQMERLLTRALEPIQEKLDEVDARTRNRQPLNVRNRRRGGRVILEDDEEEDELEELEEPPINRGRFRHGNENRRHGNGNREARNREDNNMGGIKMKITPFQGKNDPEAYLEWEKKVELVFDCHNYSELKKVKLAAIEFSDYAIVWWDQLAMNRRRNREYPIETWEEMKTVMRKRFVPSHYYRELYKRLQGLR